MNPKMFTLRILCNSRREQEEKDAATRTADAQQQYDQDKFENIARCLT